MSGASPISPLLSDSVSSLRLVDRAAHVVRAHAGTLFGLVLPTSAPLGIAAVGLYYLERVHGIGSLRLPFALLFAVLVAVRAQGQGRVAHLVEGVALGHPVGADAPAVGPGAPTGAHEAARRRGLPLALAGVVGTLLDLPLILFAAWMVRLGPLALGTLLPIAGLRWIGSGPTLLPRTALGEDGLVRSWRMAWGDLGGARGRAFAVETLLWGVTAIVILNGYAALLVSTTLGHAVLGLDLGMATSFLSPSNGFAMMLVLTAALLALEPLRMVASALLYLDARTRHEALDLRRRLDAVMAAPAARRSAGPSALAAAVLLAALLLPAGARAQDVPGALAFPGTLEVEPLPSSTDAIEGVRDREDAARILSEPEFRGPPEPGEGHFDEWLAEVMARLIDLLTPDAAESLGTAAFPLPGAEVFGTIGALILAAGLGFVAWVWFSSRSRGAPVPSGTAAAGALDPRERDPEDILAEAEARRRSGDLREALRILYLATLVRLDRLRRITFDPALTNWQYLRFFPAGTRRDRFAELTRLFDHKWYGHEPISDEDYVAAHARARLLVDEAAAPEAAAPEAAAPKAAAPEGSE